MQSNKEIIEDFVTAWSTLDADLLAGYITEDGTYYNMPANPVSGRDNVQKFIKAFLSTWTETNWDILNIVAEGDVVFCERSDRTKTSQGDVDLPCLGVFEMRDGKIHIWRDYFDMTTFTWAMSSQ
ncbi:MAG: limonene-1,2-epoxide hydrolase family protein [Pseudomonadota bacterium]|nr:limonene-1,2-epoxide hydrolase family protein [Pseudomonadota bacterium]